MRIDSSAVGMESSRSYRASNATFARFSITNFQKGLTNSNSALSTQIGSGRGEYDPETGLTSSQWERLEEFQNRLQRFGIRLNLQEPPGRTFNTIRDQTISYLLDLFFGYRKNTWSPWNVDASASSADIELRSADSAQMDFYQESSFSESEQTYFSTQGTVRTSDGREIGFQVNVGMSREFRQYYQGELKNVDNKTQLADPLVINLDGNVAEISDQTFFFDIDADGVLDKVNRLGSGSGFLALDKNGDGIINDGSELFGTASGNGFGDLAAYDDDGDGWIDEDDAIWSKLKIWCKDENGNDVLYKLAEKGVGAICLQNVGTDFTQRAQDGSIKGVVRSTGVFLYENGTAGTVQHVDMSKHSYSA